MSFFAKPAATFAGHALVVLHKRALGAGDQLDQGSDLLHSPEHTRRGRSDQLCRLLPFRDAVERGEAVVVYFAPSGVDQKSQDPSPATSGLRDARAEE